MCVNVADHSWVRFIHVRKRWNSERKPCGRLLVQFISRQFLPWLLLAPLIGKIWGFLKKNLYSNTEKRCNIVKWFQGSALCLQDLRKERGSLWTWRPEPVPTPSGFSACNQMPSLTTIIIIPFGEKRITQCFIPISTAPSSEYFPNSECDMS